MDRPVMARPYCKVWPRLEQGFPEQDVERGPPKMHHCRFSAAHLSLSPRPTTRSPLLQVERFQPKTSTLASCLDPSSTPSAPSAISSTLYQRPLDSVESLHAACDPSLTAATFFAQFASRFSPVSHPIILQAILPCILDPLSPCPPSILTLVPRPDLSTTYSGP